MRLILTTILLHVLAYLSSSSQAFGQLTAKDSADYQASIKNALSVYHHFLDNPSGLYNGGQYIVYANIIKDDHPYFKSDSMNKGNIMYDSVLYENIPMFYDIVKEQVVIDEPFRIYKLSLISEKVNAFTVLGHEFIRLEHDSLNHHAIATGFYDRLYHGKINLFERERKQLQEVIVNQELFHIIVPENTFYIEIAGMFHPVNRKRSLLNLLKGHRRELQQFIRKNKLNYRRDKENTLVKVVKYYDGLPGAGNSKS
jgi:hypothetical protein